MNEFLRADLSNLDAIFRPLPLERGLFITFEGIEGSGKTTQIQRLAQTLTDHGRSVLCLREPGGTTYGEKLRESILGQTTPLDPMAECALFVSSRAQLLSEKILPHLSSPKSVVIVDRYLDSTLVYQGHARDKQLAPLWAMHQFAPLNLLPNLTFFLDIDVELSLERQAKRGNQKDYFEARARDFHERLAEGYRRLASVSPARIRTIQAGKSEEEVWRQIQRVLTERGHL